MSRTVCSWCKAPLVLKDDILVCSNTDCPACDEKYLHEALICTRKELDVAVDGLLAVWRATDCTTKQGSIAYNVLRDLNIKPLEQITALEQKDK